MSVRMIVAFRAASVLLAACLAAAPATSQTGPFAGGWTLQPEGSALNFQSVKNETKVESSRFATFAGGIDSEGLATVRIALESVDTGIDLRNVRMRFLLFETFQFPEATVTVQLTPDMLDGLAQSRRAVLSLPVDLALHGVTKTLSADLSVTLLGDDTVSVASRTPISVATADFALDGGVTKLEEAASVKIVPSATVTFDFLFHRNAPATAAPPVADAGQAPESLVPAAAALPQNAALDAAGPLDTAACVGRFEILSRTDNIVFRTGSASLDPSSAPLLSSLAQIIDRCPDLRIEIGGHTDSDGSDVANLQLSERRAAAVRDWLLANGVSADRLTGVGYGEARPVVANDTADGKRRNRRIEFAVLNS
jgi:outer membrane protein OmpA-like peptidoglycan-associated protein